MTLSVCFVWSRDPWSPPLSWSSWMEREDKRGVCEAQDSEDKGMDSDFENSENREGDPEDRGMGSNSHDADKRECHLEQEMGSNPQDEALRGDSEEKELVSNICTGEEKTAVSVEVAAFTFISSSSRVITRGSILRRQLSRGHH